MPVAHVAVNEGPHDSGFTADEGLSMVSVATSNEMASRLVEEELHKLQKRLKVATGRTLQNLSQLESSWLACGHVARFIGLGFVWALQAE